MMKLSTAIRKGMKGRGQAFGVYLDDDGNCCAIGAAFLGFGIPEDSISPCAAYIEGFGIAACINEFVEHPVTGCYVRAKEVVVDLNDVYHWSRTKIANWLQEQGL